jgi:vitamin B12 transport system substrate-binding protein
MWIDAVSIEQVAQALRDLAPYSPAPQKLSLPHKTCFATTRH